ncbi:MAG TPA: ABC transporter ATP-binding protein [Blastocatellia bacterium]|nr:ABC transporter ATP-binding protein [Blastocatellia bacterium]
MKPIIKVENLSKQYRLGVGRVPYETLRESLIRAVRAPFGQLRRNGDAPENTIWALNGVSFQVRPGEVVGIIGGNGAGKSTLLKILSRITEPTAGGVDLYGRVGSLLEVGTGFHPELSGRENIYLNGAILGMRRDEIERKFDEIVAFAEVGKFLDTPVKHYSSGMYMRLAFSVAAHLEMEILLVDEVLAVGDAAFQKKCLNKMGDVARQGRTVLFVSHNLVAVQGLCSRAIWIQQGVVRQDGVATDVVSSYLRTSFSSATEQIWDDPTAAPGNEKVRLRRACVRPANGHSSEPITVHTPVVMEFEYWNLEPDARLNLSLVVYNEDNIPIFNTGPADEPVWQGRPFPAGLFRSACYIPGDLLNDGTHRVELYVIRDQSVVIYRQDELLFFEVRDSVDLRGAWHGKWIGALRPRLRWDTELIQPGEPDPESLAGEQKLICG